MNGGESRVFGRLYPRQFSNESNEREAVGGEAARNPKKTILKTARRTCGEALRTVVFL